MARPIPPRNADPAQHPAYPTHRWWQESLYGRLSRVFMFRAPGADALAKAAETQLRQRNVLLGVKILPGGPYPARASELGLVEEELDQALGVDLVPAEERWGGLLVFAKTLRYCRRCLELGFHSMVYQHGAVARCEFHQAPLLDRCFDCNCPVVPLIKDMRLNPYCCSRCGRLFVKTVLPADATQEVADIDRHISVWRNDLRVESQAHRLRTPLKSFLPEGGDPSRHAARRLRHLQRTTAWPSPPSRRWPSFKEWSCGVEAPTRQWPPVPRSDQLEGMLPYPTRALCWLRDCCDSYRGQSSGLIASSWQRIQYLSPQSLENGLSAVAVALHLTMTKYGVYPVNFRTFPGDDDSQTPYGSVSWNGHHSDATPECNGRASGMLVAMEILAYFALCLRRCAGLGAGGLGAIETAGHESFDPSSYVPAWQLEREGRAWAMRARPRVSEKLLSWLLHRYRDEPLRRSVVCMKPQDPYRFYGQADVWGGSFSEVLLQFPRVLPSSETEETAGADS